MTSDFDLAQYNAELNALLRLSQTALRDLPLSVVLDAAFDQLTTLIAPDYTFIYRLAGQDLVLSDARPSAPQAFSDKKELGQCLCGLAASLAKPVFSQDIHQDNRCTMPACKDAGIRSFAALPLAVDGKLLGVIGLASVKERDFSSQQHVLERVAAAIALALNKVFGSEALRQRINDLEGQLTDRTAELIVRSKELERLNRLFVDREFRIKSLKDRLKAYEGSS